MPDQLCGSGTLLDQWLDHLGRSGTLFRTNSVNAAGSPLKLDQLCGSGTLSRTNSPNAAGTPLKFNLWTSAIDEKIVHSSN
jgi:hypothetical protein